MSEKENEIFTIKARKCLRCGRLLVSREAVRDGYGCRCKMLEEKERQLKSPLAGQMSIEDFFRNDNSEREG